MRARGLGSVVFGLALYLQGCGVIAGKTAVEIPQETVHQTGRLHTAHEAGTFQVWKGRPGAVIGAPHGTSDRDTDLIGRDLARLTGFGLVVARGFSRLDADGRRFNVNRPTESVPGVPARLEGETVEARRVYEAYRRRIDEAAQGPLDLYVEVHGNAHHESVGRLEIATVGLSRDDAWRLKTLFELYRDARVLPESEPRLDIWIELIDPLRYTAAAAKQSGMLATPRRALHIELPRAARTTSRELYTGVLADVLIQSTRFLMPPH